jgi:hypothetical protein
MVMLCEWFGLKTTRTVFTGLASKLMATVSTGLASKPAVMVFSGSASKPMTTVFSSLASKLVATVFAGLASKPVATISSGLASKSAATVFVGLASTDGDGFLQFGLKTGGAAFQVFHAVRLISVSAARGWLSILRPDSRPADFLWRGCCSVVICVVLNGLVWTLFQLALVACVESVVSVSPSLLFLSPCCKLRSSASKFSIVCGLWQVEAGIFLSYRIKKFEVS